MSEIIPAVLAKTPRAFEEALIQIPPELPLIHIDVLEHDVWVEPKRAFEAHLMVKNPEEVMPLWIERGAKRIIAHQISENILHWRGKVEVGLGVEMQVPLQEIFDNIPYVDFVHLMSIDRIGEQGYPFDERIFDRIKSVKEKFPKTIISIDGGVGVENFQRLIDLGVERLVVGHNFKDVWSQMNKSKS
ncbi:hypothetical protein KW785_03615 [Candidatus Parcubacteria bacterium]|nr:hypothetical protein [Candidatus Parcubacteria bacterium]